MNGDSAILTLLAEMQSKLIALRQENAQLRTALEAAQAPAGGE